MREIERSRPGAASSRSTPTATPEERDVFLDWVLTAEYHDNPKWRDLFREAGYTGDYYWTILEAGPA